MFQRLFAPCLAVSMVTAGSVGPVRADLVSPTPDHHVGEARTGPVLRHTFTLINQGNQPIEILEAKPGCGCLRPALDRKVFAPGEQGNLSVEVNTVTQGNAGSWRTTVRYRDQGVEKDLPLVLRATLKADLTLEPATLQLHARAGIGSCFTLTEWRKAPLDIQSAVCNSSHIRIDRLPPQSNGQAWVREIRLTVLPTCPDGRHEDMLHLHTGDPECPVLKVPFTVIKHTPGAVRASPPAIHLLAQDGTSRGPMPSRIVLLSTADDKPVLVERITCEHTGVKATFAAGPGPRTTVRIQVEASGPLETRVRVQCKEPAGQTIEIPVWVRP